MNSLVKRVVSSVVLVWLILSHGVAQQKSWGEQLASTVMKANPDSIVIRKYVTHGPSEEAIEERPSGKPASWNYEYAVLLKGFEILSKQTGNAQYLAYSKKIIDNFVRKDGSIRSYDLVEFNIDHVTPGRILLTLYQSTKEDKYKKAAQLLRTQLDWQPRTKEGGFWHKLRYPYQMWLDGLYMGDLFYAEYAQMFNSPKDFDDVANQFIWMEKHSRDDKTGLLYHAWDESKQQPWADPLTGRSPGFWSRSMGWYAVALVDVLDYLPKDHPKRNEIIAILKRLCEAVKNYQDQQSGVWYQVTDKASVPGNYLESSGSSMFVFAFAKGARMGYIDKSYQTAAKKGFEGLVKNFILKDDKGGVHLTKSCSGAGLGGTPYRDGSFEYYVKEPKRTDDLKAMGPFIQASIEIEIIENP